MLHSGAARDASQPGGGFAIRMMISDGRRPRRRRIMKRIAAVPNRGAARTTGAVANLIQTRQGRRFRRPSPAWGRSASKPIGVKIRPPAKVLPRALPYALMFGDPLNLALVDWRTCRPGRQPANIGLARSRRYADLSFLTAIKRAADAIGLKAFQKTASIWERPCARCGRSSPAAPSSPVRHPSRSPREM